MCYSSIGSWLQVSEYICQDLLDLNAYNLCLLL